MNTQKTFGSYLFSFILITAILLGGLTGYFFEPITLYLKPFGEIFLNLIFTAIVPLIFFSVSSAIARVGSMGKLGKIAFYMIIVFLFTGIIAAVCSLFIVSLFPPAQGVALPLSVSEKNTALSFFDQIAGIFTVPEFSKLLSHQHILALIIFSILVGLAASNTNEKGKTFIDFLKAGEEVFMRVFTLIMYYAPFGFLPILLFWFMT